MTRWEASNSDVTKKSLKCESHSGARRGGGDRHLSMAVTRMSSSRLVMFMLQGDGQVHFTLVASCRMNRLWGSGPSEF